MPVEEYCRQIEGYLCRKNDGHLIRVVGPSFDLVSGWAIRGIPLSVALSGIDRSIERHSRKHARRRPIKIDFCEGDVLDAFDEWRRAVGISVESDGEPAAGAARVEPSRRSRSLPGHLERVLARLSAARANGSLGPMFDELVDRVAHELDAVRAASPALRGEARQALLARLTALDAELLQQARSALDDELRADLIAEADDELAGFRDRMMPEAFARARDNAFDRLLRDRYGLPVVTFQ